jgi:hypothetical protein
MCSLINRDILTLDIIDNLFSYRFFLAVNNPYVQEKELVLEKDYYVGIFSIYQKWVDYKTKRNLPIVQFETALSNNKGYQDFINKKNKNS